MAQQSVAPTQADNAAQRRFMRFVSKQLKDGGCWLWEGTKDGTGYGHFGYKGRNQQAHRVAYEWFVGPIPKGLELDHLCRVRHCVNPIHLAPVTHQENAARGAASRETSGDPRVRVVVEIHQSISRFAEIEAAKLGIAKWTLVEMALREFLKLEGK